MERACRINVEPSARPHEPKKGLPSKYMHDNSAGIRISLLPFVERGPAGREGGADRGSGQEVSERVKQRPVADEIGHGLRGEVEPTTRAI